MMDMRMDHHHRHLLRQFQDLRVYHDMLLHHLQHKILLDLDPVFPKKLLKRDFCMLLEVVFHSTINTSSSWPTTSSTSTTTATTTICVDRTVVCSSITVLCSTWVCCWILSRSTRCCSIRSTTTRSTTTRVGVG